MSAKHYAEHRARLQFARKLEQLGFELRMQSPRRVLDYLVDHLDDLIERVGDSRLRDSLAAQLDNAKAAVRTRHNLRVVKGTTHV